jgi:hypothetical protein
MNQRIALIVIVLAILSIKPILAQKFNYGVYLDKGDSTNSEIYKLVDALKMNTIVQYVNGWDTDQQNMLKKYDIVAVKNSGPEDAILHYSSGYYTKWEAEARGNGTGMKSTFGSSINYKNSECWTSGVSSNNIGATLLTGPSYRQDKKYRLIYMPDSTISYTLRTRLAASDLIPFEGEPNDPVCKISVVFKYKRDGEVKIDTLEEDTLLVSFFNDDNFKNVEMIYSYPANFEQYNEKMSGLNEKEFNDYDDTESGMGIQFQVIWYGKKQLYVDKFEVYDNAIGITISNNFNRVDSLVRKLVNTFNFNDSINGWHNIKYFFNVNEPQTIDQYTPTRMVDSILQGITNVPRGIAEFYPQYGGGRNGDNTIQKYKEMVNPAKIMMEFINYYLEPTTVDEYERQRWLLHELDSLSPNFWYEPMIAEPRTNRTDPNSRCWLRMPENPELNASIMLALAHGAKGVIVWKMSHGWYVYETNCGDSIFYKVLVDIDAAGNILEKNPLYYYFRDEFGPRITGILGKTLIDLTYTKEYLNIEYQEHALPKYLGNSADYLSVQHFGMSYHWHAGFFGNLNYPDNKYFLLTNLRINTPVVAKLNLTNTTGYSNMGIRNIEDPFDSLNRTITTSQMIYTQFSAGEGRLYQVASVVKYGGTVITNDTIKSNLTVNMNLTLTDTIFINTDKIYTINAPIDLQNGGFITGNGYIKSDSNFVITTNSWSRALLKGRVGNYPKLYWGSHPTISQMSSFMIYRKKQTPGFVHIATVSGTSRTYVDSAVTIPQNYQQNETTAEYYIVGVYSNGKSLQFTPSTDTINYHRVNGTGLEKEQSGSPERITEYKLEQNYPNPFNPTTTITYQIKEKGFTTLKIYDLLGKLVTTLVNEEKENGKYSVEFNASKLSSGVYIYEMRSGNFLATKKFIMLK